MTPLSRRTFSLAAAGALAAPTVLRAAEKTVRIATLEATSGPASDLGLGSLQGEIIKAAQINAAGGIKALGGAKIDLVHYDTQSSIQVAQNVANQAIQDGAVAVLGTSQSNAALATTTVCERSRIPTLVPGSVAPAITERGYKYTFRLMPTSEQFIQSFVGAFDDIFKATNQPFKKLLMLYEDSAYGQSNFAEMQKLKPAGLEFAGAAFQTGSTDMSPMVQRALQGKPDLLMVVSYVNDGISFALAQQEANANFPIVFMPSSASDPAFVKGVGDKDAESYLGLKFFAGDLKLPDNPDGPKTFNDAYEKKYGPLGQHSGLGCTALHIMVDAIERAGSTDHDAIREALTKTNFTQKDGLLLPYKSVQFDEHGQNKNGNAPLSQITKGNAEIVWPLEYAAVKVKIPMPTWQQKG